MVNTRKHSYGEGKEEDDYPLTQSMQSLTLSSPPPETLAEKRMRWSALLHAHQYHSIITQVLAEELPKYTHSTVVPTALASVIRVCVLILASAPLIFTSAVDGGLVSQFQSSEDLQREYKDIQAPSANQYMAIRDTVLKYISDTDSELAHLMDSITPPPTNLSSSLQGHRKYLWTRNRSPRRLATLLHFCDGIRARWLETPPHERDAPFAHPPGECGYALNSHTRLHQHRRRQSSNYVMNLTEDICTRLHASGVFPTHFYMHQFVIYLIFRPSQVRIAEIFCSGLLQVWIDNGGGFNHYPAGLSNASGDRVAGEQWRDHERWVREGSRVEENVRRQREMVEGVVVGLEREEEEVWRRAVESSSSNSSSSSSSEEEEGSDGEWIPGAGEMDADDDE